MRHLRSERGTGDNDTMTPLWGEAAVHPSPQLLFATLHISHLCVPAMADTQMHSWSLGGGEVWAPRPPVSTLTVGRSFLPHREAHRRPDRMVPDKAMECGV